MGKRFITILLTAILCFGTGFTVYAEDGEGPKQVLLLSSLQMGLHKLELPELMPRFVYQDGYDFERPKHVRGIYSTFWTATTSRMGDLIDLIDSSDLNSIVIDLKDASGTIAFVPENKEAPFAEAAQPIIKQPKELLKRLEKHDIWPIARIVCFKDDKRAHENPELSFRRQNGELWTASGDTAFINPFLKKNWEYNASVAIAAAKMGFQEIQIDYVRFPEGFQNHAADLKYSTGNYEEYNKKDKELDVQQRVNAVTDFVEFMHKKLAPYDVELSVDIFGYTATLPAAPGIGQNMTKISKNVDIISSMIYPSHWTSYFGIRYPDLHPYELTVAYAKAEKKKLGKLEDPPIERPWIQDFTASWLPHHRTYGAEEVEAQIRALNENGIHEFLIWDANNTYSQGVDYTPLN
ncbi:MAG TPA: putative glycoside hydrolase [Bacillales bacterium]